MYIYKHTYIYIYLYIYICISLSLSLSLSVSLSLPLYIYIYILFDQRGENWTTRRTKQDQTPPKTQNLKDGCTGITQVGTLESKPFAVRGLDS